MTPLAWHQVGGVIPRDRTARAQILILGHKLGTHCLQSFKMIGKNDPSSLTHILKCCISNKLSQIVCLINTHILICWHARCNCKLRKVHRFNWVLWKFKCLIRYSSSNFHKFYGQLIKMNIMLCYCTLWMYVEHKSKPM